MSQWFVSFEPSIRAKNWSVLSKPSPLKRYKITFFKKLIVVTTCNIVGTQYW